MINIGFEKEFFCLNDDGDVCLVPDEKVDGREIPRDDCGWLFEARSQPFPDVIDALFSLRADTHRIQQQIEKWNQENDHIHMDDSPVQRVPQDLRHEAQRKYIKGLIEYENLYGHTRHRTRISESPAGVHISFSNIKKVNFKGESVTYKANFDWPRIFTTLDREFENEIRNSRRNPGFYELKHDGRVEYRSLPSNIDLDRVVEVLAKLLPHIRLG